MSFLTISARALCIGLLLTTGASAQQPSNGQKTLPPALIRKLLREPHGIEKMSSLIGDVVLNEDEEQWGEHTLATLTRDSDLIVSGQVIERTSSLSEDGDDITSIYDVVAPDVLKGRAVSKVRFITRGGSLTLPNGHVATLTVPASQQLVLNRSYILFLKKQGDFYVLMQGTQGILPIDDERRLHVSSARLGRSLALRRDVEGQREEVIANKIRRDQ